jgi:hypothetical protein
MAQLHALDLVADPPRVYTGAHALIYSVSHLPAFRALRVLLRVPGLMSVAQRAYVLYARGRRSGCACGPPTLPSTRDPVGVRFTDDGAPRTQPVQERLSARKGA